MYLSRVRTLGPRVGRYVPLLGFVLGWELCSTDSHCGRTTHIPVLVYSVHWFESGYRSVIFKLSWICFVENRFWKNQKNKGNSVEIFKKTEFFMGSLEKKNIFKLQRSVTDWAIVFAEKFLDKIKDNQQLQRFLGSLNYLADFYKDLAKDAKPLLARLKKNPIPWTEACTKAVQRIKMKAKELPCLAIPHLDAFKIVEIDASKYGYRGILKQELSTKRITTDSASSNLKRMDDGYKRTTRLLASFIEAEHWGSDPKLVAQIYMRDRQSPTIDSLKIRRWFETILIETGCACITHYYKSNNTISYSKLIILDVFSHQEWGENLFREQKFKDPRVGPNSYHFFDYVQSRTEILNYQNHNYGHSWFIKLSITTKNFNRVPIPCWFQQWLLNYDIVGDALPECVLEASNKFYQHNKTKVAFDLSFLYFLALYQVSWILRWKYYYQSALMIREREKMLFLPFLSRPKKKNKFCLLPRHYLRKELHQQQSKASWQVVNLNQQLRRKKTTKTLKGCPLENITLVRLDTAKIRWMMCMMTSTIQIPIKFRFLVDKVLIDSTTFISR
ncbi:hypothetical protein ACOSQ3_010067 [Xanthoceras sorbifolium]